MATPQFYVPHVAKEPESSQHTEGIRGWLAVGGWMVIVGDLLKLFAGWWSEVSAAHRPSFLPQPSAHPVIRVTVRSCLAPIGHANNSFNNPGSSNISLLFGSPCHAKNPVMENHLHDLKSEMTERNLCGCGAYPCFWTSHIERNINVLQLWTILQRLFCLMCINDPLNKCSPVSV